jgi:hypothetical protein
MRDAASAMLRVGSWALGEQARLTKVSSRCPMLRLLPGGFDLGFSLTPHPNFLEG